MIKFQTIILTVFYLKEPVCCYFKTFNVFEYLLQNKIQSEIESELKNVKEKVNQLVNRTDNASTDFLVH